MAQAKSSYAAVCADPFDAPPAGLPDDYEGQTIPYKIKASYVLSTNDNGSLCIVFCPIINGAVAYNYAQSATCTTLTNNITAFTGVAHPDAATVVANFYAWRPISAAIKVFYLGAEATSAGVIGVGHSDGLTPSTANIGTHFPLNLSDWFDMASTFTQSVTSMTEPSMVAVRAFDRCPFITPNATGFVQTFPAMWLVGTNLPVSLGSAVRVECVLNCEMLPFHGNALTSHMQTVTQPNPASIMTVHRSLGVVRTGMAGSVVRKLANGGLKGARMSPKKLSFSPSPSAKRHRSHPRRNGPVRTKYTGMLHRATAGYGGFTQPSKVKRRGGRTGTYKKRRI